MCEVLAKVSGSLSSQPLIESSPFLLLCPSVLMKLSKFISNNSSCCLFHPGNLCYQGK